MMKKEKNEQRSESDKRNKVTKSLWHEYNTNSKEIKRFEFKEIW